MEQSQPCSVAAQRNLGLPSCLKEGLRQAGLPSQRENWQPICRIVRCLGGGVTTSVRIAGAILKNPRNSESKLSPKQASSFWSAAIYRRFFGVLVRCVRRGSSPQPRRATLSGRRRKAAMNRRTPKAVPGVNTWAWESDTNDHAFRPVRSTSSFRFSLITCSIVSRAPRAAASRPRIAVSVPSTARWTVGLSHWPSTIMR
jgi:hypothetical protein